MKKLNTSKNMSQKVSWTVKCLTGIDVKFIELLLYRGIRDNLSHPHYVGHHFADLQTLFDTFFIKYQVQNFEIHVHV